MSIQRTSILLALALLALSLIAMGYSRRQPQIEAGGGFGWDGREYADAYEDAVGGSPHGAEQVVSFPFCKRVGLPAIAATIHSGDGFKGINAVAGLIAALGVFAVGLRRGGTMRAIAVTIPMAFYLFAPIRFSNFYPWTVDPPMMAMMALAVLAFDFRRHTIGFLLLVAAIPIKETALYFAAAALVSLMIFDDKPEHRAKLLRVGLGATAIVLASLTYRLVYPNCSGSALGTIRHYGLRMLTDPWRVLTVVSGIMMTLGAFLPGFRFATPFRDAQSDPALRFAWVSVVIAVAMGALGGLDSTRLFYVCYPCFVALICRLLDGVSIWEVSVFSVGGLVVNRWLSVIPEPATYTPDLNSFSGYFVYFPDVANPVVAVVVLVYFMTLYGLVSFMRNLRPVASSNGDLL